MVRQVAPLFVSHGLQPLLYHSITIKRLRIERGEAAVAAPAAGCSFGESTP